MARIELIDLVLAGRTAPSSRAAALPALDACLEDGDIHALCGGGKAMLLDVISGLAQPMQGRVLVDGRDVTGLPPEARNIARVFQPPVIYGTMTVFDNLAFPLRNHGWKSLDVHKRVAMIAEMLGLSDELTRTAAGLPLGVRQRVALGRGLVRPNLDAVLLDESPSIGRSYLHYLPMQKLREIHRELKTTLVYAASDSDEAAAFADKVVPLPYPSFAAPA
jgi:glycerol transport system ATP-binding protein